VRARRRPPGCRAHQRRGELDFFAHAHGARGGGAGGLRPLLREGAQRLGDRRELAPTLAHASGLDGGVERDAAALSGEPRQGGDQLLDVRSGGVELCDRGCRPVEARRCGRPDGRARRQHFPSGV
jgi:hypothetical protein